MGSSGSYKQEYKSDNYGFITHIKVLMTPLITTHEPPSMVLRLTSPGKVGSKSLRMNEPSYLLSSAQPQKPKP